VLEPVHVRGEASVPRAAAPPTNAAVPDVSLEELERLAIFQAIDNETGNRKRAAARLGIGLRTLYEKLKKYGITE
jgi:two-component system response regulator FlrC